MNHLFKFLKNKIKDAVGRFTKSAEEEVQQVTEASEQGTEKLAVEKTTEPIVEEKPIVKEKVEKVKEKPKVKEKVEEKVTEPEEKIISEPEPIVEPEPIPAPVVEETPSKEEPLEVEDVSDEEKEYEDTGKKRGFLGKLFHKKEHQVEEDEEVKETSVEPEPVIEEPVEDVKEEILVEEKVEEPKIKEKVTKSGTSKKVVSKPEPISEPVIKEELLVKEKSEVKEEPEVVVEEKSTTKNAVHAELFEAETKDTTKQKKGFFGKLKERVVKFQLTDEKFEELFWDFELALLENNVAVKVIEKIKKDLHSQLTQENVTRKSVEEVIIDTLKESLSEILDVPTFNLLEKIKTKTQSNTALRSGVNKVAGATKAEPFVICMIGVNGSGKTTTLAKLISYFQKNNLSMVVAAADTFRAAAIQQLEEHTTKLGVKLIKHDYNADPAAVAFDAIKHATAKGLDVVLIDTAGRLQSNSNLMDELKKLIRVNKPDMNIFIGESITGNDCVEQAVAFNEAVGIDGIILSKADVDDKGGAAISVSYVTGKPILYLGTGQTYDNLEPFDKNKILENLGL